jgi:hypothetical protein
MCCVGEEAREDAVAWGSGGGTMPNEDAESEEEEEEQAEGMEMSNIGAPSSPGDQ